MPCSAGVERVVMSLWTAQALVEAIPDCLDRKNKFKRTMVGKLDIFGCSSVVAGVLQSQHTLGDVVLGPAARSGGFRCRNRWRRGQEPDWSDNVDARQARDILQRVVYAIGESETLGDAGVLGQNRVVVGVAVLAEQGSLGVVKIKGIEIADLKGNGDDDLFGTDELLFSRSVDPDVVQGVLSVASIHCLDGALEIGIMAQFTLSGQKQEAVVVGSSLQEITLVAAVVRFSRCSHP
ncbi:unnamed protein product [Penicillium salamii]|nr:unnamed protein product [Penicillium salamii]CAG8405630.1 unnamed protein product [Penicillium salamii]